jgi:hypothetical protein
VPAKVLVMDSLGVALTEIEGDVPERVIVPPLIVKLPEAAVLLIWLAKTVPLTVALPLVAVKLAMLAGPLVKSHGVPVTPVQLLAVVSHVPLVEFHVPVAA